MQLANLFTGIKLRTRGFYIKNNLEVLTQTGVFILKGSPFRKQYYNDRNSISRCHHLELSIVI